MTALAPSGAVVRRGGQLWAVDGKPTVLLYGQVALYRTLSSGVSDGADVKMLEQNLAALGFTSSGALTVDEHWASATTAAVEAWQESLSVTKTGNVAPDDVVVATKAVRIDARDIQIGAEASAGAAMLDVSTTSVFVSAQARLTGAGSVRVGDRLALELNNRVATHGTVSAVSRDVSQSSSTAPAMVDVVIELDDRRLAKGMVQGAPVNASKVVATSNGPIVPLAALHAASNGQSVVTVDDGGRTHDVVVTPGVWSDGLIAVSGDLHDGEQVLLG